MNRNTESHFAELPQSDIQRSRFDRSCDHLTSFNFGELIPFFWDEVLPSDTFDVSTSIVARMQTLLTPIMSNAYIDVYYFFVPNRIIMTHWPEFMGENKDSAWIPQVEYSVPKIESPEGGWNVGTIADYMGIPTGQPFSVDSGVAPIALPFRAYAMICDEWFRDENLTDPLNIPLGDANQEGSNGSNYITDVVNGGKPFIAAKYHDLFTSCLPSPQRGPSVGFNFDATYNGQASIPPLSVYASSRPVSMISNSDVTDLAWATFALNPEMPSGFEFTKVTGTKNLGTKDGKTVDGSATFSAGNGSFVPYNLATETRLADVDVDFSGIGFTINELRLAFQLQKYYEKLARGGSRYREIIKVMFNTTSPDARMMIPEYLGGKRFPINIRQVENQSQGEEDFLGDVGAMSLTADADSSFIKSFTEHGIIIGVMCARYDKNYPQGLSRDWIKESKFDYYWPVFANIGEQPVYKYEIDASVREVDGELDYDTRKQVFGYNEAYSNYRYKPSRVSAEMRPGIANSLAHWHLADYYEQTPSLSDSWIREDKANVDRVLAVTSSVSNQLFADVYVKNYVTRPMPMFSIPGLIDHH